MPNTVTTDLSSIITKATEKATKSSEAGSEELTLDAQIKDAGKRVETAGQQLMTANGEKQDVQEKLSPPPMKTDTSSSGGKGKNSSGSKQVVDEKEKDRLESQSRAADTKIQQAAAAAMAAKQEAGDLTIQKTQMGELSAQDQQNMGSLTKDLDELKKMAADPKTDLTGEAYQKKLNAAIKKTEDLYAQLPENGDAAEFWTTTQDSFKTLDAAMDEYLDIDAPPINSQNNYASFFEQTETEFTKLKNNVQAQPGGADQALVQQMNNALDGIMNNEDSYLDGVNSTDKALMGEMLRQVLVINDKFAKGEQVTAQDMGSLLTIAEQTGTMLDNGGSSFQQVALEPIKSIQTNLNDIAGDIDDPEFNEFKERLDSIYAHKDNNVDDLTGINKEDMDAIFDYATMVRDAKADGNLTPSEIAELTEAGNAYLDLLVDQGMVDPAANTNGGSGGSNSSASGGNNRFSQLANS